jgi:hypothetical protein
VPNIVGNNQYSCHCCVHTLSSCYHARQPTCNYHCKVLLSIVVAWAPRLYQRSHSRSATSCSSCIPYLQGCPTGWDYWQYTTPVRTCLYCREGDLPDVVLHGEPKDASHLVHGHCPVRTEERCVLIYPRPGTFVTVRQLLHRREEQGAVVLPSCSCPCCKAARCTPAGHLSDRLLTWNRRP